MKEPPAAAAATVPAGSGNVEKAWAAVKKTRVAGYRWIAIKVPVAEVPDDGEYFSKANHPQRIGACGQVWLSPLAARGYMAVVRAVLAAARAGEPFRVRASRNRNGAVRPAENPYDALRLVLEAIGEAVEA